MKYILFICIFFLGLNAAWSQQQKNQIQTQTSLALNYYNAKDYEKAMPLLYGVYNISKNETYFRYYLDCLLKLERYEEAEKQIQAEIKKQRTPKPEFYVHWGHVLKEEKKLEEADTKFNQAIKIIPENRVNYLITANAFIGWGEYEYAKQTYLQAKKILAPEPFSYELARIYLYLRYKLALNPLLQLNQ